MLEVRGFGIINYQLGFLNVKKTMVQLEHGYDTSLITANKSENTISPHNVTATLCFEQHYII